MLGELFFIFVCEFCLQHDVLLMHSCVLAFRNSLKQTRVALCSRIDYQPSSEITSTLATGHSRLFCSCAEAIQSDSDHSTKFITKRLTALATFTLICQNAESWIIGVKWRLLTIGDWCAQNVFSVKRHISSNWFLDSTSCCWEIMSVNRSLKTTFRDSSKWGWLMSTSNRHCLRLEMPHTECFHKHEASMRNAGSRFLWLCITCALRLR